MREPVALNRWDDTRLYGEDMTCSSEESLGVVPPPSCGGPTLPGGYQAPKADLWAPGVELLPTNATICCFTFHFAAQLIPATCSRSSKHLGKQARCGYKWRAGSWTWSRKVNRRTSSKIIQKFSGKHKVLFARKVPGVTDGGKKYSGFGKYSNPLKLFTLCNIDVIC